MEKTNSINMRPPKVHTHKVVSFPHIKDGNNWCGYVFTIQDGYDIDCGCGNGFEQKTWLISPDGTCSYGQFSEGQFNLLKGTCDSASYEEFVNQMVELKTDWMNELLFEDGITI